MQVSGKVLGSFNLVAIVPTPSSGTRLLYQKADGSVKTMDGKSAFTNQLANFGTDSKFNSDSNIMPDFPADTKKLFTLTLGSITLNAYMALAIEVAVTGDNVFTAQAGAYASASMSVGLFIFQKISGTCSVGTFDNGAYSASECLAVADAAGTNPTAIGTCTPPTSTSTLSGKCIASKYLVIQVVDGPTLKSGLNGPSLKADKNVDLTVTVSIYPIAKITAYDGIFSLYASPKLKAVITGKTAQTGCSDGVQIQVISSKFLKFLLLRVCVHFSHSLWCRRRCSALRKYMFGRIYCLILGNGFQLARLLAVDSAWVFKHHFYLQPPFRFHFQHLSPIYFPFVLPWQAPHRQSEG